MPCDVVDWLAIHMTIYTIAVKDTTTDTRKNVTAQSCNHAPSCHLPHGVGSSSTMHFARDGKEQRGGLTGARWTKHGKVRWGTMQQRKSHPPESSDSVPSVQVHGTRTSTSWSKLEVLLAGKELDLALAFALSIYLSTLPSCAA